MGHPTLALPYCQGSFRSAFAEATVRAALLDHSVIITVKSLSDPFFGSGEQMCLDTKLSKASPARSGACSS